MIKVNIINKSGHPLPKYKTAWSAGMDLYANLEKKLSLGSLERVLVPTGIYIELPKGYEAQIRPRSGMAAKQGISVLNTPGTIDADYRGEIKVILANISNDIVHIENGDRVAQMVINKHEVIEWTEVELLNETERGSGGFGHTGIK